MQIDKDTVIQFLQQHGNQQQADQANQELPQQVDTEQHSDLLSKYGIDIQKLIGAVAGNKLGGNLGGQLGRFL